MATKAVVQLLDGSINIFKLATLYEVRSINLGNIKNEFLQLLGMATKAYSFFKETSSEC